MVISLTSERKESGNVFLTLVTENVQASNRISRLAAHLHHEALNIRIKTARFGREARTFAPIASEISGSMRALGDLTNSYRLISEDLIQSIAYQVKMLRLAGILRDGMGQMAEAGTEIAEKRSREYTEAIGGTLNRELNHCLEAIKKLIDQLEVGTRQLKQTALSGRYTSEVALIESAKINFPDAHLANSSTEMSKLLAELSREAKELEKRLLRMREQTNSIDYLHTLCNLEIP